VSELGTTADPSTSEAVEELLRQLVDARFVLTDRDGAVTRWSRPAEELFGWPGARMLGRPLAATLALEAELPETGGQLQALAHRKDGTEVELALTLVPVRMSQSLEFNGFLEALEIAAPRGNALAQLQLSHRTVVEWISAAIEGQAELDEDGLAAGTIIAFRPLREPSLRSALGPVELDMDGLTTAAAAGQIADAVEVALGRSEGVERALEDTAAELGAAREEAEAARGEAARATAKLDLLEQADGRLGSELDDTRRMLEEMSAQVDNLRGELELARTEREERARAERERLGRDVEEQRAERERLRRELEEVRTAVEGLRGELAGAPQAQERLQAQLERTREGLEDEFAEIQGKLEALEDGRGDRREDLVAELAETRGLVESLGVRLDEAQVGAAGDEEAAEAVRAQVEAASAQAQAAAADVERLVQRAQEAATRIGAEAREAASDAAAEAVRAQEAAATATAQGERATETAAACERQATRAERAATGADQAAANARRAAKQAETKAESARQASELAETQAASARQASEDAETQATSAQLAAEQSARGRGPEIEHQIPVPREASPPRAVAPNGDSQAADDRTDPHRPLFGRKPDPGPARERRSGFDDIEHPMAVIELDGHFRELNAAFSDLVGYSEDEFKVAVWPPVMDRANLEKHRDQMKQLIDGAIESAEVKTGYVHAQGLLVPVNGRISLVREGDEPRHFLLEAASA